MTSFNNYTQSSFLTDLIAFELRELTFPLETRGKLHGIGQHDVREGDVILELYITEVYFGSYPRDFISIYLENVEGPTVRISMMCQICAHKLGIKIYDLEKITDEDIKGICHKILYHVHCHNIRLTKRRRNRKYELAEENGFVVVLPGC